MRCLILILAVATLAAYSYAEDNASINRSLIDNAFKKFSASVIIDGSTIMGGTDNHIGIEISKPLLQQNPLTIDEKINALQQKLFFYTLLKNHNIDPGKKIAAIYTDRPVHVVLQELLPKVPVVYDGVDKDITVGNMTVSKSPLEKVCEYLDYAAGVYFEYSEQRITVKATNLLSPGVEDKKASVRLMGNSYSANSVREDNRIKIAINKQFSNKNPLTIDERINALQQKLYFYILIKKYNLDPCKKITAVYTGRHLNDVLQEILPKVPTIYDGVDKRVIVGDMTVSKGSLEKVCEYLDYAAGVYFEYSEQGITVKARPLTK